MTSTENRTVVNGRPEWAEEALFNHDTEEQVSITYMWTAPTVAQTIEPNGDLVALRVYVQQLDDLRITDAGVEMEPGRPTITFSADDVEMTPTEARRLAAALIEAADQIDVTTDAEGER